MSLRTLYIQPPEKGVGVFDEMLFLSINKSHLLCRLHDVNFVLVFLYVNGVAPMQAT